MEHTYRALFLPGMGLRGQHFLNMQRLANLANMSRVRRPKSELTVTELVQGIRRSLHRSQEFDRVAQGKRKSGCQA